MFVLKKFKINKLFVNKIERIIEKVQIKKLKNSTINPLFKPIIEVIKSKVTITKSM